MNDETKKTDVESCDCGCGCGSSSRKYNWIWIFLALALAVAVFGKLARKGPSSCAGGFCPFPAAAADSNAAPAATK
jgi:hypothetical protein